MSLSLKQKLIILLCFLCFPQFLLSYFTFKESTATIERNSIEINQELIQQMNRHLDAYFQDIERITLPLLANSYVTKFLNISSVDPYQRLLISKSIGKEVFAEILLNRTDIFSISLVSHSSIASSSFSFVSAEARYENYLSKVTSFGKFQIVDIHTINQTPVITIALRFYDTSINRTTGMLFIDLRLEGITDILRNIRLGKTGYVTLVDSEGKYVYHPDATLWRKTIPSLQQMSNDEDNYGSLIQMVKKEKMLVTYHRSNITGLLLVAEVPLTEVNSELMLLRNATILLGVSFFIFSLMIIGGFSLSLSNKILYLNRLMKRAEMGDLSVAAAVTKENEIGYLFRGFNNMVREIRRLIEVVHASEIKEKELELVNKESKLLAMQSQINPHFLYNTLEIINSYAILEGNYKISKMATSLSDLFRYSTSDSGTEVSLYEEVAHINTYLGIQQERYGDLEIEVDTDVEETKDVKCLRLIIQPIIENAFKHGYEGHKRRPEYIGIVGKRSDTAYIVHVIDKGGGMEASVLEKYNSSFSGMQLPQQSIDDHLGLLNVHHRLRLLFGNAYGLHILKSDDTGTIVQIKLPYEYLCRS